MKLFKPLVKPKIITKPAPVTLSTPVTPTPKSPLSHRFRYIDFDDISKNDQREFRELFTKIEALAEANLRESRAKSLLMTYLEVAYLWTGKAIRDEQMARQGKSVEQDQRSAD